MIYPGRVHSSGNHYVRRRRGQEIVGCRPRDPPVSMARCWLGGSDASVSPRWAVQWGGEGAG